MPYTHLTPEDRIGFFLFVCMGMSWATSAGLGRNQATLSRELRHNDLAYGYRI